ncbi:hypothetical protein Poli38472_014762 [Pythium oligandrum]|uniref:Uncharacterized protein n=1 Tax=Pythium oligandrum TaxID=41045 RepID=A0A8K1FAE9_PYTOL|nr:hypothetical protein Poli38472_014762 [Pythium oligandrum]|eukprot:TMW54991.1 hypothetical protein Poli38472_014762 [Pythium oligandrum]
MAEKAFPTRVASAASETNHANATSTRGWHVRATLVCVGFTLCLVGYDIIMTSQLFEARRQGKHRLFSSSMEHRSFLFEGSPEAWQLGIAGKMTPPNETNAASNGTASTPVASCSPTLLDSKEIHYRQPHRFYEVMQSLKPSLPPPVFYGDKTKLCDAKNADENHWSYCLPIRGRKDSPYCEKPDRMDLLTQPHTPDTMCFASALYMLLVDVYDELQALHHDPALLYGSMLGAMREGSTIPFTEDADIGYRNMSDYHLEEVRFQLRRKGYHFFKDNIYRVCIAPNHPLAAQLYDPSFGLLNAAVQSPYVDLYEMRRENETHWAIQETWDPAYRVPNARFEPYKAIQMNGLVFNTLADPQDFLVREYGKDYMIPKPRPE